MLLQTKLFPPPKQPTLVARRQLTQVLESGLPRKLTLLSAPAGFGKTMLVAAWLHEREVPFAWLSLDEGDNDPVRFWTYVVAALHALNPGLSRMAEEMLQAGPPPLEMLVTTLINGIVSVVADSGGSDAPYVLVLDDYHVIKDEAIHRSLNFLLDHQPPHLHLIITSRVDPPLKLSRRRGRREMVQLRAADLRFSPEEATHFLNSVMALDLSASDVRALVARTEGWIASLQLAALSLQHHPNPAAFIDAFAGDDRYVVDYLVDEVFAQQPEAVQDFLVKTSILNRFCGPICDVLRDEEDRSPKGQAMLDRLEHSNLFLVPLDNRRQWYRYHHLFADMLRQRLHERFPGQASRLHRKASRWFEQESLDVEAIHHAMAGEEWDRAVRLIARFVEPSMKRAEFKALRGLLEKLPPDQLYAQPQLCLTLARVLNLTGAPDQCAPYLDRVEALLDPEADRGLLGIAAGTRAHVFVFREQYQAAIPHAERALELLPQENVLQRSLALAHLGVSLLRVDDLTRAGETLLAAREAALACGNLFTLTAATTLMGMRSFFQGNLRAAEEHARQLEHRIPDPIRERMLLVQLLTGTLSYEHNRLAEAEQRFQRILQIGRETGRLIGPVSRTLSGLAQIQWVRGEREAAWAHTEEALHVSERLNGHYSLRHAQAVRGRFWLEEGNLDAAARLCTDLGIDEAAPLVYQDEGLFRVLARLRLAERRFDTALGLLDRLLEKARAGGRMYDVVQLWVLRARVQAEMGDLEAALETLRQALVEAKAEGYVRTFLDEGAVMGRLLYQASVQGIEADEARRLLAPAPQADGQAAAPQLIESLSDRELDVLRLLAEGLSNPRIAERLFVSLNTVKTHTKNIYGKLGVGSRREAVSQARAIGLL